MSKQESTESDSDEYELWTRRQTMKTGAAAAYPLSHADGGDGWFSGWSLFSSDTPAAVRVLDGGTEYDGEHLELGTGLSATETPDGVQLDASGSGGGGAFEDTDGDGVAELQDDHVDLLGGDLRGVAAAEVGTDPQRSLVSNSPVSVTVPGDYDTIQAAIDDIPLNDRHKYDISIDDGDYAEDLHIKPGLTQRVPEGETAERTQIRIIGNSTTPSNVTVNSLFVDSLQGMGLHVKGIEFTSTTPFDNEGTAIAVYGCPGRVLIDTCNVAGTQTAAVLSYASYVTADGVDFGGQDHAGEAKHGGRLTIRQATGSFSSIGLLARRSDSTGCIVDSSGLTNNGTDWVDSRGGFAWVDARTAGQPVAAIGEGGMRMAAYEAGDFAEQYSLAPSTTGSQTTTSTSYTGVGELSGVFDADAIGGASLVGNFICRLRDQTSGETASARPVVRDTSGSATALDSLSVSVSDTALTTVSSGWQSLSLSGLQMGRDIQAKTSGGTAQVEMQDAALLVGWRM